MFYVIPFVYVLNIFEVEHLWMMSVPLIIKIKVRVLKISVQKPIEMLKRSV